MLKINSKIKYYLITAAIILVFIGVFIGGIFLMDLDFNIQKSTPEELRAMSIEQIVDMPEYDGRDYGIVTPISDQEDSGLCWAYSSISASETSILRSGIDSMATKKNLSLSPLAVGYSKYNRGSDPLGNTTGYKEDKDWFYEGGNSNNVASLFSSWCGPTSNTLDYKADQYENCKYKLVDAVSIDSDDVQDIKTAVATYGAVTFSFNSDDITKYYNPIVDDEHKPNHGVTIVGWDDDIAAKKFAPNSAKQDGGWLVKNSWSKYSYFYISYDCQSNSKYAFDYVMNDEYDYNYFYNNRMEYISSANFKENTRFANVYEAKKGDNGSSEYIEAVNIGINKINAKFKLRIYTNVTDVNDPESGWCSYESMCTFDYSGFRIVKLKEPIKIEKGSNFSIVVDIESVQNKTEFLLTFAMGSRKEYYSKIYSEGHWGLTNSTIALKAFTKLQKNEASQSVSNSFKPDFRYVF